MSASSMREAVASDVLVSKADFISKLKTKTLSYLLTKLVLWRGM